MILQDSLTLNQKSITLILTSQVAIVLRYLNLKLRNNGFVKTSPRFDSAYIQGENKMHVKKTFDCCFGVFLLLFLLLCFLFFSPPTDM